MAVDFQVAFPTELIKVSQVRPVPSLSFRAFEIIGEDFRSVGEVLMNEIPSPDVVILGKNRMLAQVPKTLEAMPITSITVVSNRLVMTERSYIRFKIGRTPSKTRGILRLMQLFLKILFTTPGTDIFANKIGGAGLSALGSNFGRDEGGEIISSFVISVDTTLRQIIQIQSRDPSIPPDERLLAATVVSAGFNPNEAALITSIELTSQAGQAAIARLEL